MQSRILFSIYETRLIRLVQSEAVTLKLALPRTREPTGCFRRQFLGTIQPSLSSTHPACWHDMTLQRLNGHAPLPVINCKSSPGGPARTTFPQVSSQLSSRSCLIWPSVTPLSSSSGMKSSKGTQVANQPRRYAFISFSCCLVKLLNSYERIRSFTRCGITKPFLTRFKRRLIMVLFVTPNA